MITAACVKVPDLAVGGQAVRDSKFGEASPVLSFTTAQVSALAAGVQAAGSIADPATRTAPLATVAVGPFVSSGSPLVPASLSLRSS